MINNSEDKDITITHYTASKVVTWVSAIVIPLVAGFAWVANTAISVNERITKNSYQIDVLSKNQTKLINISDRLNEQVIESRANATAMKESQEQMLTEIHDILIAVRPETEIRREKK